MVEGGGVAAERRDGTVTHLRADQSESDLPTTAQRADYWLPLVFFEDGTVCGVTTEEMLVPDGCGGFEPPP